MSVNNLTGSSPANTRHQLLHMGNGTLGSTYVIRFGDGTASPLGFTPTGISSTTVGIGTTNTTTLGTLATTARAVNLADAEGTLFPATTKVLSATVNTATASTTPSTLSDFNFTPDASSLYEFDALLIVKSNNATVGITLKLSGPSMTTIMLQTALYDSAGAVAADDTLSSLTSGTPANLCVTSSMPAADTNYLLRIKGFYKTGGSTGAVQLTLTAEINTAASYVSAVANSLVTHTKRA